MNYVLVIDDHPEAAILALRDEIVATAGTPSEARVLLSAIRPDAVVLDLGVSPHPEAFAREVRRLFDGRLIVDSAADPHEIRRVCSIVGARPLPKPYLARDLVCAVRGDSP